MIELHLQGEPDQSQAELLDASRRIGGFVDTSGDVWLLVGNEQAVRVGNVARGVSHLAAGLLYAVDLGGLVTGTGVQIARPLCAGDRITITF